MIRSVYMAEFDKVKLDRINELAHEAKKRELTPEELKERDILRKEFLANFRRGLEDKLQQIQILEPDGSVTPVVKKNTKLN